MEVKITKDIAEALGNNNKLRPWGMDDDSFRWAKSHDLDLTKFTPKNVQALLELIQTIPKARGAKTLIADLSIWVAALSGSKGAVAKNMRGFEAQLRIFLAKVPGHRIYQKDSSGVWQAYYVNEVTYHEAKKDGSYYHPAHATMGLLHIEMGGMDVNIVTFEGDATIGVTPEAALNIKGYVIETPHLRSEYLARKAQFQDWSERVGKQYWARGLADEGADGNTRGRDNSWYWRHNTIQLDKGGEPSRVVMDVFYEGDEPRQRGVRFNPTFWVDAVKNTKEKEELEEEEAERGIEVPIHATVVIFDLKRHLRLKVDIAQLEPYVYDPDLGQKLILPQDSRNLVEMLLAHRAGFKDIIAGKSGGAVILCAGIPGTGKTLTAEVYAEVMARPLYSVQASQLGTDHTELETELLKVFARAARWNAILLLDEADVYVHQRGNDLIQNAIVGVFLRVLEYYKGVLFLTTNRADLVDDAIGSRCIARIDYNKPTLDDQRRIWHILSKGAGIEIKDEVIDAAVAKFDDLTGRDVKNLLKLAKLVADSREMEITLDVIRFVKRFKPTGGSNGGVDEAIHLPPMADRPAEALEEPEEEEEIVRVDHQEGAASMVNWKRIASGVFADGAPHAASEVKEAVIKAAPGVHPNAVTMAIVSLTKRGQIKRLESGLYQKVG